MICKVINNLKFFVHKTIFFEHESFVTLLEIYHGTWKISINTIYDKMELYW